MSELYLANSMIFCRRTPNTTHLDVLVVDLCGNAIGKRLPVDAMAGVFAKGTPVCGAMQLVDVMGNTDDPMGYGFSDGDPDAFADSHRRYVWYRCPGSQGGKSQVLCEFLDSVEGKPFWYEPRQVLKQVMQRFAELKLTPRLALELEFYLLDARPGDDGLPQPAASPLTGKTEASGKVLSLDKLDEFEPLLGAPSKKPATQQGIPDHVDDQRIRRRAVRSQFAASGRPACGG